MPFISTPCLNQVPFIWNPNKLILLLRFVVPESVGPIYRIIHSFFTSNSSFFARVSPEELILSVYPFPEPTGVFMVLNNKFFENKQVLKAYPFFFNKA